MLRITVHDNPQDLTFQLEGKLAGPWLQELEECWKSTLASQVCGKGISPIFVDTKIVKILKPILRVDLTGVTFIDDAGKICLAAMHSQGAEFVVADCLTKDIVAEICQGRSELRDGSAISQSRRQ